MKNGSNKTLVKGEAVHNYENKFGDRLVSFPGINDWGDNGWFIGIKTEDADRGTSYRQVMFYDNKEDATSAKEIKFVAEMKNFAEVK